MRPGLRSFAGAGAFGHIAGSSGDTRNTGDVGIRFEIALKDQIALKEMIQIFEWRGFFLVDRPYASFAKQGAKIPSNAALDGAAMLVQILVKRGLAAALQPVAPSRGASRGARRNARLSVLCWRGLAACPRSLPYSPS